MQGFSDVNNSRPFPKVKWPDGLSESEKDELREVLRVYNSAVSDIERDHTVIFPSDEERLRLFHAAQKRWAKAWSKQGPCVHPGCTSQSILRSHTIPMSASLRAIAEEGHLVTPRFGRNGLSVARIGVKDASTFPGFCRLHEAQFAEFESQKKMTTADHFYLQAFRTICREIFAKRHYDRKLQSSLDDYRKLREAFMMTRMMQVHGGKPIKMAFTNDPQEDRGAEHLKTSSQDLIELERLRQGVLDALKTGSGNVAMIVSTLDLKLPVCLSGIGILNYRANDTLRRAVCFLAVVPEGAETKLIIGAEAIHANILKRYTQDDGSLAMLGRVESWMCHGSDHWFMTPSAWNAIPLSRQDVIRSRILDEAPSIAHPVEFSVLDGARNLILASAEEQLRQGTVPAAHVDRARRLIADERAKLN